MGLKMGLMGFHGLVRSTGKMKLLLYLKMEIMELMTGYPVHLKNFSDLNPSF